jgi:DNA-binding NarL/FixJ family response regulator
MNLFAYLPSISEKGRCFLDDVRLLPSEIRVEVFDSRAGFIRRLRQPKEDSLIVVLFDPSHEDLESLRNARQLLVNVPLLIVLADQDALTMALAHRLLPSYITYVDSDPSQLFSVISKLAPAGLEA